MTQLLKIKADSCKSTDFLLVTLFVLLMLLCGMSPTSDAITPVAGRTPQVRDAIVEAVPGVNSAADVTEAHLAAITRLDLSSQFITALKSGDFDGLTALTWLSLFDNEISDISALSGLTELTTLYLGFNAINDISPLSGLTGLTWLALYGNASSDISPLSGLTALTTLDLGFNAINDISPLSGLTGLTYLSLFNNAINDILPLSGLTQLTELHLDYNNISDISALSGLTQLPALSLHGNEINDISPLSGLTALTALDLSYNAISDISVLSGLTTLTYIYLGGNEIRDISALSGLTQLTTLWLHTNNISDVSPLSGLTQLTWLYLRGNEISDISALSGLTQLTTFSLGDNSISDISALSGLTQLTTLDLTQYLGGNEIRDISSLSGLTALTHLHLGSNEVSDISALSGLTQLTWLDLLGNEIRDISSLSELTALTYLSLIGNEIRDISVLSGLTQLTALHLSNNGILDISPLVELDLSGTQWNSTGLSIEGNPLNYASVHTHIPAMQAKGIEVKFDNREHSALGKISGDMQEGEANTTLANPFVVEALDQHGVPITELGVTFRVIEGEGHLSATPAITDANGKAQTTLTLGPNPGVIKVRATAAGITYPVTFIATATETSRLAADVNGDGVVNIQDLVLVAGSFGQTSENRADVNGDGVINIQDLVLVAGAFGASAAAPSFHPQAFSMLSSTDVKQWISAAHQLDLTDPTTRRGVLLLKQLLATLMPKATALLANYPNPFNPETWIPYQLADARDVQITIYDTKGAIVRTLDLGHQAAGYYTDRNHAAYWDGRNGLGENVASGVYFYQLQAGEVSPMRKMVILK